MTSELRGQKQEVLKSGTVAITLPNKDMFYAAPSWKILVLQVFMNSATTYLHTMTKDLRAKTSSFVALCAQSFL